MGYNKKQRRTSESVTKDHWLDGDGVAAIPRNLQICWFDLKVFSNFWKQKSHEKSPEKEHHRNL